MSDDAVHGGSPEGPVATPGRWAMALVAACLAQIGGAALGVTTDSSAPHLFGLLVSGAALAWVVFRASPDARFDEPEPRPARVLLALALGFGLWLASGWAAAEWLLPSGEALGGTAKEQLADLTSSAPRFVSVVWLSILGATWAVPLSRWLVPPRGALSGGM